VSARDNLRDDLLLAILAPGSIEAEVGRIQEEVFRARGFVSAIALEPLVPVAFLAADPGEALPRGFLDGLDRAVQAPLRIAAFPAASVRWGRGALFLGLDTGGAWTALRRACTGSRAAAAQVRTAAGRPGLFPVAEGFFLGCLEAAGTQRRSVAREVRQIARGQASRAAVPIAFSSATLAVVRITTPARGSRWWREVSCEVVAERPLRGKRS
jgi:hypothetical protein